jgi:hypothetical protein
MATKKRKARRSAKPIKKKAAAKARSSKRRSGETARKQKPAIRLTPAPKKSMPGRKKRAAIKKKSAPRSRNAGNSLSSTAPTMDSAALPEGGSIPPSPSTSPHARLRSVAVSVEAPAVEPKEVSKDESEGVVLEFTKDDNSPDDVRVTLLKPKDRVLKQDEKTGKSQPRKPGDVDALVEVKVPAPTGQRRTATIAVTNVTASPIVLTVPDGQASAEGVATLTVVQGKKA